MRGWGAEGCDGLHAFEFTQPACKQGITLETVIQGSMQVQDRNAPALRGQGGKPQARPPAAFIALHPSPCAAKLASHPRSSPLRSEDADVGAVVLQQRVAAAAVSAGQA